MIITENHLDEWVRGNAREAQGLIVELVWRLVVASCPKPKECRFPLGDSIGQHGSDGVLDVGLGFDPFVPEGSSVWEIGSGLDAGDKATSDYKDSVAAIPPSVRAKATFVFVTPLSGRRGWEDTWQPEAQRRWLEDRLGRNDWKHVKILDGTQLVDWMHRLPPVEIWFAHKALRLAGHQVDTLENHWRTIRSIGEPPPLTPRLFLADRDEARAKLKAVLEGSMSQLKIETRFPGQVLNFVAACVADLDQESWASAVGRCVVVSGLDAWNSLAAQNRNLILVADSSIDLRGDSGTTLIQRARNNGHSIVFGATATGLPDPASVQLQTPQPQSVEGALVSAGYPEERARVLAQKSAGDLASLLRCLQNLSILPAWADGTPASELVIAGLLGQWNDRQEADRVIVEEVAGKEYGEWIRKVRECLIRPDTPLSQQDGIWRFVSRYEGWYALGPMLFDDHLERMRSATTKVLTERDPQFDLARDERYAAAIHGKVLAHSRQLREGLVEGLALLGSHPKALTSCSFGRPEGTAILVVRDVLSGGDWERWSSLNDVLPLLAEAAPDEFLRAVESGLGRDPCPFDRAFAEEGDGLWGRNYLTGLLWALETLAWDPDRLSRSTMCLAELAVRDPGGRTANRPHGSLHTIFLPWLPQTCASVEKRASAVSAIVRELPVIGWKLLIGLLPQSHGFSMGSRKPAWRTTIPDDWPSVVREAEYRDQCILYSRMAVAVARTDPMKLAELLDYAERLPPEASDLLIEHLGSDAVAEMPEVDRRPLWERLLALVTRHRKFSDAGWALSPEIVDRFSAIADRIEPKAAGMRYARLFETQEHHLYDESGNYRQQQAAIERRRQEAVAEIVSTGGPPSILEFVEAVQSPWRVGLALGAVADQMVDAFILPSLLTSTTERFSQFVGGFIRSRFHAQGMAWVDHLAPSAWPVEQAMRMFVLLPFVKEVWDRAARVLGAREGEYWLATLANPYDGDSDLRQAIEKLVECGRPRAAMRCLHRTLMEKQSFDAGQAARVLLAAAGSSEPASNLDPHETAEIIAAMQNDANADPDDLSRIEWAYLSLLEREQGSAPRTLERRLATEPSFFCEVVRIAFRSRKEDRSKATEVNEPMALNSYRLLKDWSVPPGLHDGSFDGSALERWLEAVEQECSESGHLEVAMTIVGQVLTKVPADKDGFWIDRSAASVLNGRDAEKIRDGFRIELFNSRGVYWVDPTGTPERELSSKYRSRAEAAEAEGFTRLATALREMAGTYDREAQALVARAQRP